MEKYKLYDDSNGCNAIKLNWIAEIHGLIKNRVAFQNELSFKIIESYQL